MEGASSHPVTSIQLSVLFVKPCHTVTNDSMKKKCILVRQNSKDLD